MRILFSVCLLILYSFQVFSQDRVLTRKNVEGVYLNVLDFKNNKEIKPIDRLHKSDRIKLKQFFISNEIEFIEQGNVVVFNKDSIFAVHLSDGQNYRFINRSPCLIADTSYMYIYTQKTTRPEYRKFGPRSIVREVPVTYYYFSVGDHKSVYLLNLNNLGKHVPTLQDDNKIVHEKYTSNSMLTEINIDTGRFIINEFLKKNFPDQ